MVKRKGNQWLFHLRCPGAVNVSLAGEFNDWSTTDHPMKQVSPGVWETSLVLKPGIHRFRYMTSSHGWVADWGAHGMEPNQDGDWDFTVHVPGTDEPVKPEPTTLGHLHAAPQLNVDEDIMDNPSFSDCEKTSEQSASDFRLGRGGNPTG